MGVLAWLRDGMGTAPWGTSSGWCSLDISRHWWDWIKLRGIRGFSTRVGDVESRP